MAEAAEESGKENYRNGWPPDGRKFSEADRGDSAAREATEKENYRGGRQRQGRLARDFRAQLGCLIVRTALPCRLSSDALNMVISSGSIFVFHPFTEWDSLAN